LNRLEFAGFFPDADVLLGSWTVTQLKQRTFMLTVLVYVHVKPEGINAFRDASVENARCSGREPGVAAFEVIQQADDPARFVLIETYRTPEAPGQHKETAHYQKWRDTVAPLMAEPRTSVKYNTVP
jgi:(4S)-4-hydroxy-5-phosphonooxypentane-2,3-dione isomerase